ncbi:MAG: MarR family transcriptional regulator [Caldilineaceae bacterium]
MRTGDRITRSIGQSSARWQVLGRIGYRPQTVAQMARDMGHARQSVQRVADVLAQEGLVSYINNPKDRRSQLLELTPLGKETLAAIYEINASWSNSVITKFDPEQLIGIANALEQIAQVLEAEEKGQRPASGA